MRSLRILLLLVVMPTSVAAQAREYRSPAQFHTDLASWYGRLRASLPPIHIAGKGEYESSSAFEARKAAASAGRQRDVETFILSPAGQLTFTMIIGSVRFEYDADTETLWARTGEFVLVPQGHKATGIPAAKCTGVAGLACDGGVLRLGLGGQRIAMARETAQRLGVNTKVGRLVVSGRVSGFSEDDSGTAVLELVGYRIVIGDEIIAAHAMKQ